MTTRPTCRVSMGLLLAAFIGCGPGEDAAERRPGVTTQPIMNGTFDPGDPATVLIGGGGGWSTGALVSPRVILTCGHCVDPQGEPRSFVYFGSSYLDGGTIVMVERSYPHPQYVSGAYPNIDLGIVVLKTAVPPEVKPLGIQTTALDGGVVGDPLRIVGFGATSPAMAEFSKMQVTVPITGIDENYLLVGPAICAGDSGGPGLLDAGQGREVIAGVVSWHTVNGAGCGGSGGLARVDTQARWIQAQIDAAEDGGGGNVPPDGGPDAGGGAPDGGSPSGADGGGGNDGGTVPSGGPPDAPDLAITGGCTAAGTGGGGPLLTLVLLTLVLEVRARRARGGGRAPLV